MTINSFSGTYWFLSNFYPCKVKINGKTYESSEAAFQAQKCPKRSVEFVGLNARESKALGKKVVLVSGWDRIRDSVMFQCIYKKFTQNDDLKQLLLETGNTYLEEGNTWGDKYWGTCNGIGLNKLGKCLMEVRELIKSEKD